MPHCGELVASLVTIQRGGRFTETRVIRCVPRKQTAATRFEVAEKRGRLALL